MDSEVTGSNALLDRSNSSNGTGKSTKKTNKKDQQKQRLKALIQQRDGQRKQFKTLLGNKRRLQLELQAVESQVGTLREALYGIDDEIADLEELIDRGAAGDAQDENEAAPIEMDPADESQDEQMPHPWQDMDENASVTRPLDLSMDVDPNNDEQNFAETLTDPLTATQAPADHLRVSATAALNMVSRSRPTLNFQELPSTTSATWRRASDPLPFARGAALGRSSRVPSDEQIHETLRETFRIQSFREHQLEVIQSTMSGQDCFVIMRTGGGKSLLYQLPIVMERPKVTLVISPLLSLIQDQQDQINSFCPGVCISFRSGLSKTEQNANWKRLRDPAQNVGMVLVTPERISKSNRLKSELQKLDTQNRLARFVIDECHCCCQWGHDFRPDYAKLGILRRLFPRVPILAVTATASDTVREDCVKILRLSPQHIFVRSSANRPNLRYRIERKDGTASQTMDVLADFITTHHPTSPGIVYTYSRKDAETVASELVARGIPAQSYHSDVKPKEKDAIHKEWMQNRTQVVVATIAFGLGINKPDVRFVIHHSMSKSLEAYYQESGRAGRDGQPADCVLYYSPKDVPRMLRMVHGESSEALIWTMIEYAQKFGTDAECRRQLLSALGETPVAAALGTTTSQTSDAPTPRDVTDHAKTVLELLSSLHDKKVTLPMLVKEWRSGTKSEIECVQENPPGKSLSVFDCECIVAALLLEKLIAPSVKYTKYDTIVYLKSTGQSRRFLSDPLAQLILRVPGAKKVPASGTKKNTSNTSRASSGKDPGWIQRKRKAPSKRQRSTSSKSKTKKKSSTAKPANRRRTSQTTLSTLKSVPVARLKSVAQEVIDICDSSIDEEEPPKRARTIIEESEDENEWVDDPDEEYEFDD